MLNDSEQNEQHIKTPVANDDPPQVLPGDKAAVPLAPKTAALAAQKEKFISHLRENGGNVSKALLSSGLQRNTAYGHLRHDKEFAEQWLDATEAAYDELYGEARRRALEGVEKMSYKTGQTFTEKSDVLLIFPMKQKEATKRWRARIVETGNVALESARDVGIQYGLSEDVIKAMQSDVLAKFKKISLV